MMRNATRDLLQVSLTVAAVATALLAAELSARSAVPVRRAASADTIVHVRSIVIARRAAEPDLGQPAPAVTLTKPSPRPHTVLAWAL